MKALIVGCEKYYRRTFSEAIEDKMIFHDHIGFVRDDLRQCTLELILDDIDATINNLSLDKVVIVGHSINAYIAAEYAKKFPHRIKKVIIIGSGPYTDFTAADNYFENIASNERKAALNYNLKLRQGHFANDPFIDRMLRFGPMLWHDYNYDAKKLWSGIEFNDKAAEIIWGKMFENYKIPQFKQETLIMIGKYDFFNPPNLWCNKNNIVIFEKSGHNSQVEESKLFDETFLKFIN
jgi:proline iminopeptidase